MSNVSLEQRLRRLETAPGGLTADNLDAAARLAVDIAEEASLSALAGMLELARSGAGPAPARALTGRALEAAEDICATSDLIEAASGTAPGAADGNSCGRETGRPSGDARVAPPRVGQPARRLRAEVEKLCASARPA